MLSLEVNRNTNIVGGLTKALSILTHKFHFRNDKSITYKQLNNALSRDSAFSQSIGGIHSRDNVIFQKIRKQVLHEGRNRTATFYYIQSKSTFRKQSIPSINIFQKYYDENRIRETRSGVQQSQQVFRPISPSDSVVDEVDTIDERPTLPQPEIKEKNKTTAELYEELKRTIELNPKKRYKKPELIELAKQHNIPLTTSCYANTIHGWVGAPKGLRQVCYERGLIDTSLPRSTYTKLGKKEHKDNDGNVKDEYKSFCLSHLLSNCTDFKEEKTALECLAEELSSDGHSIHITLSTPYHPELAGEGIELVWGLWKKIYRHMPWYLKKGIDGFNACINTSLNKISVNHIRNFSAKARRYMLAYLHFNDQNTVTYSDIEKMVKQCKTHRNTQDQETGYIAKLWKQAVADVDDNVAR